MNNEKNWITVSDRLNHLLKGEPDTNSGEEFMGVLREGFILYTEEENKALQDNAIKLSDYISELDKKKDDTIELVATAENSFNKSRTDYFHDVLNNVMGMVEKNEPKENIIQYVKQNLS